MSEDLKSKLSDWLKLYDCESYLFEIVSQRFRERHTLEPYDFFAIVTWKSNRSKTKIKTGLVNAKKTVKSLMQAVWQARNQQDRVKVLSDVYGIGLPIASAILAVCYPEEFTVLDERAWNVLKKLSIDGLPPHYPQNPQGYIQYCEVCRKLAKQANLSLRDLDRALWAKSWVDSLRDLVADLTS